MDVGLALATLGRALVAYAVLLVYIRLSGNRTLAKLRAFDLVVTIALGSLLATTVVASSVPFWQGLLAMGALVLIQFLVAKLSVHSRLANRLVTSDAIRLYHQGEWDERGMRKARITRDELESAMRDAGHDTHRTVSTAWLEVNGDLSVTPQRSRLVDDD